MYSINKSGLQHCTTDAPNTHPKNQPITITLTPDSGYMFDVSKPKPYVMFSDGAGGYMSDYFTVSANGAVLSNKYYNSDVYIYATCYPAPETTDVDISELQNCTINQNEGLTVGDTVELTITPNEGFEFTEDQFNNNLTTPVIVWSDGAGGNNFKYFNLVDGVAVASWVVNKWAVIQNAICYPAKKITKYGAVNVYSLDADNLDEFSNVRFLDNEGEIVDLGNYVNRLFRIFVNVDIDTQDYIRCGRYNTDILVDVPETDLITLNFGSVAIPEHNGNITDYNSTIQLFLPFIGVVDVPNDYIGTIITLVYEINIVLGRGVVKLYANGVVFQYYEVDVSSDMIYKTLTQDTTYFGSDSWGVTDMYGLEPYVIFKWYDGKQTGIGNTYQNVIIGDCSGFNAFDDVEPITRGNMLIDEQKMIYNKLMSGVYI